MEHTKEKINERRKEGMKRKGRKAHKYVFQV